MGGKISMILSGTGILIAMYLILKNSSASVSIVNQLGKTYTNSVKTLQGRQGSAATPLFKKEVNYYYGKLSIYTQQNSV